RRIQHVRKLFEWQIAFPTMRVISSRNRKQAIAARTNRDFAGRLVSNVSIDIGIDDVLRRSTKPRERGAELLPIPGHVHVKERISHQVGVVECPLQRNLSRLSRNDGRDDGPMPGDEDVKLQVSSVLNVDGFKMPFWRNKALRRIDLLVTIKVFDEEIFYIRI